MLSVIRLIVVAPNKVVLTFVDIKRSLSLSHSGRRKKVRSGMEAADFLSFKKKNLKKTWRCVCEGMGRCAVRLRERRGREVEREGEGGRERRGREVEREGGGR
jgi:hypothetical protein